MKPAATENVSRRRRGWVLVVLGLLVALGPLSTDAYVPGLPAVAADMQSGTSSVQLTVTACLIGLALGQLIAGPLSDAVGRRRPLLSGLVLYTVAGFLCAVAPTVGGLITLRALQGLGGAFALVIAYAVTRDLHSGKATARAFASLLLVTGIAPIVAPLGGAVIIDAAGWRGVFAALAAVSTAVAVATAVAIPETIDHSTRPTPNVRVVWTTYRTLLHDRTLIGLTLTNAFAFAAMFAYISGAPFILRTEFGISTSRFSVVFAVNAVGLVIAAQLSGRAVGIVSPKLLLRFGIGGILIGGSALLATGALSENLWLTLAALFVTVSSVGIILPVAAASALEPHGDDAGAASALLGCTQFLVAGAVAPLVGLGPADVISMATVIVVLAVAAICAAATVPSACLAPAAAMDSPGPTR